MRAVILSAAFVAAMGVTAWTPSRAEAQVVIYPSINTSPYAYTSYWYPGYRYAYNYASPYYSGWRYGWSNPWNYGNYYRYNAYPYYTGYYNYWGWPRYGWRGRYWRW